MQVARTIAEMRAWNRGVRRGATVAFVPTMGAIHEGHLSLVRGARNACDLVAASLFVNPLQFAAGEDLERYPRTFEADCRLLDEAGVDVLFAPGAAEMYPPGATTFVEVADIGDRLDGASRPGHFRGVATVVAKLFGIVQPDVALFGQKDAAQVAVLRAMVRDLNMPVELLVCPTVREPDGLAMSSRNRFLSAEERAKALALRGAIRAAEAMISTGERDLATLHAAMCTILEAETRIDYAEVVDPDTLQPVSTLEGKILLAVAASVGSTRLIDNSLVQVDRHG